MKKAKEKISEIKKISEHAQSHKDSDKWKPIQDTSGIELIRGGEIPATLDSPENREILSQFKKAPIIQSKNVPDTETIEDSFSKVQNRNESVEVLHELFDEKKIYMISELSQEQINIATRIYMIAQIKHLTRWEQGLAFFMKLLLSKNRKSRDELLSGMSAYQKSQQSTNPFFNNWGNRP